MIGRSLSHYRVIEEIGAGGMGVVYRARDDRLHRDVAVKVLPPGLLADEAARKRFRKEALALSQLNHPNIATIHDFDSYEGVDFLVMELIEGETLSERLRGVPLPEREILNLAEQLLRGLAAAHANGVIHRDLKPSNIRVTTDGRLKILDFGLAILARPLIDLSTTATMPEAGGQAGTLPYMAPEQLQGRPLDARGDVYAAGAVLYEMACGRRAFPQISGTEVIGAILHAEPPAPRTLNTQVSPGLEHVILKTLEKEPARRYQSAGELAAALDGVAGGSAPGEARPVRRMVPLAAGLIAVAIAIALAALVARSILGARSPYGTVAVLPFENASGEADLNYLSDGITEGLINALSVVPGVQKVISRASVFEFKGKRVNPREAGARLGVRCLVIGRVARAPDGFLVSAELIDTKDGRHVWGRRYARTDAKLSSIEVDLATGVSAGLNLARAGANRRRLTERGTMSEEAYRSYLRGRYYLNENLRKALDYFEQALAADPTYAAAHVGLCDCYIFMASGMISPDEAYPKARAAAQQALRLDPDLGEAHAALAIVRAQYDWAWDEAEAEFKRAIELSPSSTMGHLGYGLMLTFLGRSEQALVELRRARELDPLSPGVAQFSTWPLWMGRRPARRLAEAIREQGILREQFPDDRAISWILVQIYLAAGRTRDAVAEADRAPTPSEEQKWSDGVRGYAYAWGGRRAEARRILGAVERRLPKDPGSHVLAVFIRIGLGEHEAALNSIERAVAAKDENMLTLGVSPMYDPLRSSPRFRQLLAKMNLPLSLADG